MRRAAQQLLQRSCTTVLERSQCNSRAVCSANAASGRGLSSAAAAAPTASFPTRVEEVTEDWLTRSLLQGNLLAAGGKVQRFATENVSASGLSRSHRVFVQSIDAKGDALPMSSAFLKFAPTELEERQLATSNKSFEREVGYYKAMVSEDRPLPTPRFLSGQVDKREGAACLALEDMEGFSAGSVREGMSADAASMAVEHLGTAHARFWNGPQLKLWKWAPELGGTLIKGFEPQLAKESLTTFLDKFGDEIPKTLKERLPQLPTKAAELLDRLGSAQKTLLHGNLLASNILYRGGEPLATGEPEELRYVDFANAAVGRGPFDVAKLLVLNMDPIERAASEHSLMAQYYEHITEGGVTMYSMYDAWEDYKYATAYLMCVAVNIGGVQGLEGEGEELARLIVQRAVAAVQEVDGCASLL